jgi:hypothetical protein
MLAALRRGGEGAGPAAWQVGQTVAGLYEVRGVNTEGGMSVLYFVWHRGWGRELVLKSPRPELLEDVALADALEVSTEAGVQNSFFTASQARVVAALWAAWQKGFPELGGHHLFGTAPGRPAPRSPLPWPRTPPAVSDSRGLLPHSEARHGARNGHGGPAPASIVFHRYSGGQAGGRPASASYSQPVSPIKTLPSPQVFSVLVRPRGRLACPRTVADLTAAPYRQMPAARSSSARSTS